jgi:hypothetical protein
MRLEPLYTVTFTTPEAWSVEVASDTGIEGRSFLLAEGRSRERLSARYRAADFPRKRTDAALLAAMVGAPDRMFGGAGKDYIDGVDGIAGNDTLNGSLGTDHCVGDKGDTFKRCEDNVVAVPVPSASSGPTEAGH